MATTTKRIKRVKENICEASYNKLMTTLKGGYLNKRPNSINNFMRWTAIAYHTGLRCNEVQALSIKNIRQLVNDKRTKVTISKTSNERVLYASDNFVKVLKSLFDLSSEDDDNLVICSERNKNKRSGINHITFIQQINKFIHYVLGDGYSSHSMRQNRITSIANQGVSAKHIAIFMNIDVKTALNYIRPSEEDIIKSCLIA